MSILIKGMEMPKSCLSCPLQGSTADCRLTQKTYNWGLPERPSDCPLVPVPPHGRLIDADKLLSQYKGNIWTAQTDYAEGLRDVANDIKQAPTVIEAEEGET